MWGVSAPADGALRPSFRGDPPAMKFGLLSGAGDTFAQALAERIDSLSAGESRLEDVSLGIVSMDDETDFDCVIDRISTRVPFYRAWLRGQAARGVQILNDPNALEMLHGYASLALLRRRGCPVPKTVLLPQKAYDGVAPSALDHLEYPLDWAGTLESLGGVAWLKSALCDSPWLATRVSSVDELLEHFDRSGSLPLVLQADVAWDRYVRVFTFGGKTAVVARYDPAYRQYLLDPAYVDGEMEDEIARGALIASDLLGLDVNAVDIAIAGDRWWIIDPLHPVPDFEKDALTPPFFEKVVASFAQLCLQQAGRPKGGDEETDRKEVTATVSSDTPLSMGLIDLGARTARGETPPPRRRTGEMPTFREEESSEAADEPSPAPPRVEKKRWRRRPGK